MSSRRTLLREEAEEEGVVEEEAPSPSLTPPPTYMNAFTLHRLSKWHLPDSMFLGVYAADQLPRPLPRGPCGFVANTDPVWRRGRHWVAFSLNHNGYGHYFDSFGKPPPRPQWRQYLERHSPRHQWFWSMRAVPRPTSQSCGPFTLYYLHSQHTTPLTISDTRLMHGVTERDVYRALYLWRRACRGRGLERVMVLPVLIPILIGLAKLKATAAATAGVGAGVEVGIKAIHGAVQRNRCGKMHPPVQHKPPMVMLHEM